MKWRDMRDVGVVIGLLCGTIAAVMLLYYAWPDRKEYPPLFEKMLYLIVGLIGFLWVAVMAMWFSV